MRTSKKVLIILSAVVWYIGGIMLFRSGFELLLLSTGIRPGENWPWVFIGLGILLGVFQASMIFNRSCRKNITRIRQLEDPRIWQFFRPWILFSPGNYDQQWNSSEPFISGTIFLYVNSGSG